MIEYAELRRLESTGAITAKPIPAAQTWLNQLGWVDESPTPAQDRELLTRCLAEPDPLPLLCLRSRVSHPIYAWIRATHEQWKKSASLDLGAMASYALDDDGKTTLITSTGEIKSFIFDEIRSLPKGPISPFTAEVIRTYDPSICKISHWARMKIKAHNGIKAYFKQNGLLIISDWALLRDTSPKKVREACEMFLRTSSSVDTLIDLHSRYRPLHKGAMAEYKAQSGKASGWKPDTAFLKALEPEHNPFDTMELLLGMARAIRQLSSGKWIQSIDANDLLAKEPVDSRTLHDQEVEGFSPQELQALI